MWFMSHLDPLVHGNTMIHVGSPNLVHVIPVWELHDLVPGTSLDFFFDKKKEVYSRSYLIKKNIRQTKDDRKYKNKNKKQRKKLITKERSKERNEWITRSESLSLDQLKREPLKEASNWSLELSMSSKACQLRSFQIHHIKHNGTKFQMLDECFPN